MNYFVYSIAFVFIFLSNTVLSNNLGEFSNKESTILSIIFDNIYYILLFIIIILLYNILIKSFKIYQLSRITIGNPIKIDWNYNTGLMLIIFSIISIIASIYEFKIHGIDLWFPSATLHGQSYDIIFKITTTLALIVFFVTHIILFIFLYKYKRKHNNKAYYITHNNNLEILWTSITAIILSLLVIYGSFKWYSIINPSNDMKKNAIIVELTGEQFKWTARYAGNDKLLGPKNFRLIKGKNILGIDFNNDTAKDDIVTNEIVLPVNKPVKLLLSSKDVIHSAYIPEFRIQMNAVPGMYTSLHFIPTITTKNMKIIRNNNNFNYILYCNKICGSGHFNMWIKVSIVDYYEYSNWLNQQKPFYEIINS